MNAIPLFVPPLPPSAPPNLTAFQAFRAFRTNALHAFSADAYNDDVLSKAFAGQTRIIVNKPAAIRQILIDNAENYTRTKPTIRILRPLIGNGLFLNSGEDWRHQRRTLAPSFTPQKTMSLIPLMAGFAKGAIAGFLAKTHEPLNLLGAMQSLALTIAGGTMFSMEMQRYGKTMRDLIQLYAESLGRPYILDFLLPLSIPSPHDVQRVWFRRKWRRFLDHMIAERRAIGAAEEPRDLFDLIVSARDPDTGEGFSARQLADEVSTMIVAGHETTALTLFWSLYLLAQAQDVQHKVAQEVEGLSLDADDAAQAIRQLPYTRAVVQEALRLYPPAYAILRQSIAADTADGIAIPPKAIIMISPWILHRHRKLWLSPDSFDPSRFLPDRPQPDRFVYLPFGIGPRVCIGAQFALAEAVLVLASFIQKLTIQPLSNRPVLPSPIVTCQPNHAPLFRIAARHG